MTDGKNMPMGRCPAQAAASFPPGHGIMALEQGHVPPPAGEPRPPVPIILYIPVHMSVFMCVTGAPVPTKLLEVLGPWWAESEAGGGAEQIASDGSVESLKRDKN